MVATRSLGEMDYILMTKKDNAVDNGGVLDYNRRNLTSNIATANAGYRAIVYRALHSHYAAERMHDTCVFTTHQLAQ